MSPCRSGESLGPGPATQHTAAPTSGVMMPCSFEDVLSRVNDLSWMILMETCYVVDILDIYI